MQQCNAFFLGVTYFAATRGKLCSETGDVNVEDLTTCKEASKKLGYTFRGRSDMNNADWPKGCYYSRYLGGVYFNHHTHGKRNPYTLQICKSVEKGMSLTSFVTSMRSLLDSEVHS